MELNQKLLVISGMAVCLGWFGASFGTSLVYNIRIRRVFTGLSAFANFDEKPIWAFASVPIFYHRTAHIVSSTFSENVRITRNGGGALFNVRYVPTKNCWFEVTTAVHKESLKTTGTECFKASRAGFDDVVLAGGFNKFFSKDTQGILYFLGGFPTRTRVMPQETEDTLVGTRFYAMGAGAELSYSWINTKRNLLAGIVQARTIHFFDRRWEPLLTRCDRVVPGQVTDILLSLRYRHKQTVFETGYNPTIFTNQAVRINEQVTKARTAIRHGTYASVLHLIKESRLTSKPIALGGGFLFNRLKRFDANTLVLFLNITFIF